MKKKFARNPMRYEQEATLSLVAYYRNWRRMPRDGSHTPDSHSPRHLPLTPLRPNLSAHSAPNKF